MGSSADSPRPADERTMRGFWERRARDGAWDGLYEAGGDPAHHRFRARFVAAERLLAPLGRFDRVLDAGCGTGDWASLRAVGDDYVGVDFSPAMIARARSRASGAVPVGLPDRPSGPVGAGRVRFGVASAAALPFRDASFDLVLAVGLIGFQQEPERTVAELRRVLRAQGSLLLQSYRVDALARVRRRRAPPGWGERAYERAQLDALAARAGLRSADAAFCDFRLLPAVLRRRFPRVAERLSERVGSAAHASWARPFAASVVVRYVPG